MRWGVNGACPFWRQQSVERLLVERARFAIHRHEKCFVTERLNIFLEMLRHKFRHGSNALI